MRLAHLHLPNITPFTQVSHIQEALTTRLLSHKKTTPTQPPPDPTIITFTPNPVYTTGRRDLPPSPPPPPPPHQSHKPILTLPQALEPIRPLLCPPNCLNHHSSAVAEYHPTLRGGQTTYHGPGQMVAYTILDLRRLNLTPRCHIRLLENSVIDVLAGFAVKGRITEDPGVWVDPVPGTASAGSTSGSGLGSGLGSSLGLDLPKKITAVGVHLRRNVSSFGIGFNVTQEPMWYFRQIVPCGLHGREATSLEGVGVRGVSVETVAGMFVNAFVERFNRDFGSRGERVEEVYRVRGEEVPGYVQY